MIRLSIVKQSDVSHGTSLHYADDWTYGHKALCGKTMRSTARDHEIGFKRMCASCAKIMAKRVEAAHTEALLTQVELDHALALEIAKDRLDIPDFDEEAVYAQAIASVIDDAHPVALEFAEIIAFEQTAVDGMLAYGAEREIAEANVRWFRDAARTLPCSAAADGETQRYYELMKKHGDAVPFLPRRFTESARIHVDKIGEVRHGVPKVGDFVLISNAGGRHQSPGSYGYTRTEVIAVEHEEGGLEMYRFTTKAFGEGCWSNGDRLICV